MDVRILGAGQGWHGGLRAFFAPCFPFPEFGDFRSFAEAPGTVLKSEPRTRIVLIDRPFATGLSHRFLLKTYFYSPLTRLRTPLRMCKARREFESLLRLRDLGVPAVEPVGYGWRERRGGFIDACFVVTSYENGTVDLRRWLRAREQEGLERSVGTESILQQVGGYLRRLHDARFFLFTSVPKNILLREGAGGPEECLFSDLPYARTLGWRPLARWAQGRDLGAFLASFFNGRGPGGWEPFLDAYLPDPLGGTPDALLRSARRAALVQRDMTAVSAFVKSVKRRARF